MLNINQKVMARRRARHLSEPHVAQDADAIGCAAASLDSFYINAARAESDERANKFREELTAPYALIDFGDAWKNADCPDIEMKRHARTIGLYLL